MKWAVITGASSGLGQEFAWQLACEPLNLVLVARREDRLQDLANQIRAKLGVKVEVLVADLATSTGRDAVAQRVADVKRPVGVLVNNAGYTNGSQFIDVPLQWEVDCLNVMVLATMELSHTAVQAMKKTSGGAIINVASVAAGTSMGTYATHKTWIRAFTEALAVQLIPTPVSATVVNPGPMDTEFFAAAGLTGFTMPRFTYVDPAQVVSAAIEAARRRRVITTPTCMYLTLNGLVRLVPRWLMRRATASRVLDEWRKPPVIDR